MIVGKRELEFFGHYLDCNSLPVYQDTEKIELVIRVACGAKGLWKPRGMLHPDRWGKDRPLMSPLSPRLRGAWSLGTLLDQGWHRPAVQLLFRITEASVFCHHEGYLKQLTDLEDFDRSPAGGCIHVVLVPAFAPSLCSWPFYWPPLQPLASSLSHWINLLILGLKSPAQCLVGTTGFFLFRWCFIDT